MAQLYKLTVYVCDLEENMTLEDIKSQIKYHALDSCSINCICHFDNEVVGKQIEWDDDVDINYRNCPTSAWDKYFE